MIKNKQYIIIIIMTLALLGMIVLGKENSESETSVTISEVCAHNVTAAYDDNAAYGADYIELYNASEERINLEGWGLTDDGKKLAKYVFPEIWIEPGQCVIAWCSEDTDDKSLYNESYVPVDVHGLGFNLSNGEAVVLTDDTGAVVSSMVIPGNLQDDKVYACARDNLASYAVSDPTPYYVDDNTSEYVETIAEPTYSVQGGWYENPIQVELSAKEGDIYYTLDGSDPDENSYKYEGPITVVNRTEDENIYSVIREMTQDETLYFPDYNVDKVTVLKAVAISDNGRSDIAAETYFVGLDEEDYAGISVLSISGSPEDFFGYDTGIYVVGRTYDMSAAKWQVDAVKYPSVAWPNYGRKGRGWEREVQVEYLTAEREKALIQNVGIRIHGGASVVANQKNFQLYARDEYDGNSSFVYDFFGHGDYDNKVMLRGGGSDDTYMSKIRDVFEQSLVTDRDFGTQEAVPCAVFLNGEYWGMYNVQETIGTRYISNHFGVDEDNILIVKNNESRSNNPEDVELYNSIVDFAAENDLSVDSNYRYIEEQIDIQSYIDYYTLQIYTGNNDAYLNNIAMWRSFEQGSGEYEDCKWRWLVFDLDGTANTEIGGNTPEVDSFNFVNIHGIAPLNGDVLFTSLLENAEFKERFVTSFMDMANNNFYYPSVSAKLWAMADIYRAAVVKSHERYKGDVVLGDYPGYEESDEPYSEEDFGRDIGYIDAFFNQRYDYIVGYMKDNLGLTGDLCEVNITCTDPTVITLQVNTSAVDITSGSWTGKYYSDYPITLTCSCMEGTQFAGWQVDGEIISTEGTLTITPGTFGNITVVTY